MTNTLAASFSKTFDNEMNARKDGLIPTYETLYDRAFQPAGGVTTEQVFEAMGIKGAEKLLYLKGLKAMIDVVFPDTLEAPYSSIPAYTENNDGTVTL